jgi:histidinol-phosphate aminotransferase
MRPKEAAMSLPALSRRRFASFLGASLGAALVPPRVAHARRPAGVPDDAILLNSNENPYGPSPAARAAMSRAHEREAARYPDANERAVVEEIARHHAVSPEQVVLGCGSGEILRIADMAFLGPGRTLVVAEPTFEAVLLYARVTKAEGVKVPLTADHRHDLGAMAAACDARTGLVYVCNPNNPTGTIVSGAELRSFLDRVPRSAVVLVDEAYHHFVEDTGYRSATEWLARTPNLVVARTFSKIHGLAGMRLGYSLSSVEIARALREHLFWNNTNASVLAAALASIGDTAHVEQQRRSLNATRAELCAALRRDGRAFVPSHANFVLIEVGGDVQPLIEAFRARGILVGRKFPSLPHWLRVSIGTPEETRAFLSALRELVPARAVA